MELEELGFIFLLLLGVAFVFYIQYGCAMHVDYYDHKISELYKKIGAISCTTEEIRCRELYYDLNHLIAERNNLICVDDTSVNLFLFNNSSK